MAATDTMGSEWELPPRKKPKISELPLSSSQRASIDGMLHTFKKKGEFDVMRKKSFQQYNESAKRGMFEAAIRSFSENEIERDPIKYLKPDRRIAAPLLEGAAARADVYLAAEKDVDAYIEQYMQNAEQALRSIRATEVGGEQANEEYRKGIKSDEAYAEEADVRRQEREIKNKEEEKKRAKREAQEKKKKELEMLKKKQEALQKETERLQREQKRRAERDAWKAAEKERERERIRKYNEEREKAKKEAEEREKALEEERQRRVRERAEREQKRIEAEALELLLREGEEMAEKARRPELERSESMEPPPRLKHQSAPRNEASKNQMRAQGLMPTSLTLRKGDKPMATPPTGPRATRGEPEAGTKTSRVRSPSPSRSTYSNSRRREASLDRRDSRRDEPRRGSSYRDISTERDTRRSRRERSRSLPRRDRDRDTRARSRSRPRGERYLPRDRSRDKDKERGEEGEVVERPARSESRGSVRDMFRESNTYRPARDAPRRPSRSRSPRRRSRSRSRSLPRRSYRSRSRDRRRERSRSPPGIDRYVPGGVAAASRKPREDESPSRRRARDDSVPRRPKDEDDAKDRPREERARESTTRIRDERDRTPARTRERDRSRDRRRSRYDDRERDRPGNDRWAPRGEDEDRPRRRERSRPREDRYVPSHRQRSRSRDRDAGRDRERAKDERRPSKTEVKIEGQD